MNETTKTGIFAGVAGVLALATWLTMPKATVQDSKGSAGPAPGTSLFKEYDPLTATNLKIVRYNKDLAEISDFEVAKDKATGVWSIPSHSGYPADAEKQMSEAANMFLSLKILDIVTEKRDEHKMFGVVEPDPERVQAGDEGIGTMVRIQDDKGENLVNLVIGSTEKDNAKHRFVRVPTQDVVYIVDLDINPLTTEFTKWIEPDLLKLSSTDIETLGIKDYAILQTNQGPVLSPNFDAFVSYTTSDGKWNVNSIDIFDAGKPSPRALTPDEQLNATKLNEIRNGLDSLRIVDVRRKPKGLAANLKVENALLNDRESMIAMARKGFIPQKGQDGSTEIYAANGELIATLKDGVQYLVRFGNTTGESSETEAKEGETKSEDTSLKLDRYMLVTAKVDESKFPEVQLKPVPQTYDELLKMEAAEKPSLPEATPVPNIIPAAPNTPEASKATEAPSQEAPPSPESKEEKKDGAKEAGASEQPKSDQARLSSDGTKLVSFTQEAPQENKPAQANPAPADAKQEPVQELTDDEKKERLEAAKEKITKENQRKQDERKEKLDAAHKRVAELNARFSDWFYVISESEYKRLRIKIDELIQPKSAAPAPAQGNPAFPGGFQLPGN